MNEGEFQSPTIKVLDTKKQQENLVHSPLLRQKKLFGKEFDFYQDGSVLVTDPENNTYHFLTAKGRAKGKDLRSKAKAVIEDEKRVQRMRLLGEGKGGFSKVYEMETDAGPIALKTTDAVGFFMKENIEEATSKSTGDQGLESLFKGRASGRKIVQKMALKDILPLFKKLENNGIITAEFYGFTVRRDVTSGQIQEFQFMERINKPTIQSILEAAVEADLNHGGQIGPEKFPFATFLTEISNKYFGQDDNMLMKELIISFRQFVADVKSKVPNIADLEMDNIFLVGYNEETKQFEFLLIDPIEENVYIRPIQKKSDLININLKVKV